MIRFVLYNCYANLRSAIGDVSDHFECLLIQPRARYNTADSTHVELRRYILYLLYLFSLLPSCMLFFFVCYREGTTGKRRRKKQHRKCRYGLVQYNKKK